MKMKENYWTPSATQIHRQDNTRLKQEQKRPRVSAAPGEQIAPEFVVAQQQQQLHELSTRRHQQELAKAVTIQQQHEQPDIAAHLLDNTSNNNICRDKSCFQCLVERADAASQPQATTTASGTGQHRQVENFLEQHEEAECRRLAGNLHGQQDVASAQADQPDKEEENQVNLSFCGCGFLGIYHVGVASCFHQYAPQLSMHKIAGSSAGALVAVAHICGNLQLAYATTDILRVAIDARARALGPFHPSFDIQAMVREALERGLPDDVHEKATGKLHISLTRAYDGQNVIVNEFDSKDEVIQALLCSCFIPIWSGLKAPKFRGVTYIDGGFSTNLLILDDKTVTVSPFAGEADICPQDDTLNLLQVSLSQTSFSLSPSNLYRLSHALLPPPPEVLSDLCEQGFADGIRFLQQMKLISCTKCIEIRSSLLVTTNGEDMEEAFTQQVQSHDTLSISSFNDSSNHIRLEQQEQKMIEINGSHRRNSVVSNQMYQQMDSSTTSSTSYSTADAHNASNPSLTGQSSTSHSTNQRKLTPMLDTSRHHSGPSGLLYTRKDVMESCNECVRMRQRALHNSTLPKQFSDRIRDACDAVNKSLSSWIYSYKPIKYLSYMAAPYYLPLDLSLALVFRCWQELPHIRSELVNFVFTIAKLVINVFKRMHSKSTGRLLLGSGSSWEEEAVEYEKEIVKLQTKATAAAANHQHPYLSSREIVEKHKISAESDTNNHRSTCSDVDCSCNVDSFASALTGEQSCSKQTLRNTRHPSTTQLHSLEDTFDSIVDVTSNQEARIFAYYFRDAKNRLQVTEIFDLERAAELGQTGGLVVDQSHHHHFTVEEANHHHQQQQQQSQYGTTTNPPVTTDAPQNHKQR